MPENKCYHCGDDCGHYPVMYEDKPFCCNGCKSVYEILNGKKLYKYYQIENSPGNKIDTKIPEHKYAYLNNTKVVEHLLDFNDGSTSKVTLFIPSIHCSSCIWLLENLNTLHAGIVLSKVNFIQKKVYITYKNDLTSLKEIAELLESISYIPHISLEKKEQEKASKSYNKNLIVKLGIAGFCFGNIMLLSFPEYFSNHGSDPATLELFKWFNLILSLPVFFYSSSVFFNSAFKNLIKKNINIDLPVALGIITIFVRSLYEIVSGTGPGYMDSLAGLVFFLLIGRWYQNKTYQALSFDRGFQSYFPLAVNVLKDEGEVPTMVNDIEKDDVLVIRNKELIPVDSVLVEGDGNIDYSFVTGESVPVAKEVQSMLYAGGRQVGNIIKIKATKGVSQSYFTQLWNQETMGRPHNTVTGIVDKVSRYFIFAILLLAFLAFGFWSFNDASKAFDAFTAVLIIACPCALALSAPFTFGAAMRMYAKASFFTRDAQVVEDMHNCTSIVFDKTGTLTKNNVFDISYKGDNLSEEEKEALKAVVQNSSHPLSRAIFDYLPDISLKAPQKFEEFTGKGISGEYNGIGIMFGSAEFVGYDPSKIITLASIVCVSINGLIKGYFECRNYYRENIDEILISLGKKYNLHLLSGDNEAEKQTLGKYFEKGNMRFFQQPMDKLNYIKKLTENGERVLMVGDGLNDAGALQQCHVGISLADNVYQFSPACDAILSANAFVKLPKVLNFSKTAMKVLYASFALSFLYNIIGLSYAFMGKMEPVIAAILMPISSVSVVAYATLSIRLLSLKKRLL